MSKKHIVAAGESVQSIAFENGFFPDTVWNYPENAELKKKRTVGTVLNIGDEVFIPDKTRKIVDKPTEAEHVFRRKGVPEKLRIRFLTEKNAPRAGLRYLIVIDGKSSEGKTDADGYVIKFIPPNAERAKLTLFDRENEEHYDLKLGHLQPVTELSGIQSRLSSLGYQCLGEKTFGELTRRALIAFQIDFNLESTGEISDETRNKLREIYGA